MKSVERITICGGGNGAHALLGFLLKRNAAELTLYLKLDEELERFRATKERGEPFELVLKGESSPLSLDGVTLTNDPAEAARADLIMLVLPAFAHGTVLEDLAPHMSPGTVLAVLPARGGLEFEASDILSRAGCSGVVIAGFQTLPWACRITEYARGAEVLGQKMVVTLATLPAGRADAVAECFSDLLGSRFLPSGNMMELTLGNQGQIIHPGIMYGGFAGRLSDIYREDEIPLFYGGTDEASAEVLERMSAEVLNVKARIEDRCGVELPAVVPVSRWMLDSYEDSIEDKSTLAKMFQTNRSYRGLRVPVKRVGDGRYRIDVGTRYLTEDVPYGLLVTKAIAELADMPTPMMDEVIRETGRWTSASWSIDGKPAGKDIVKTRVPQRFGWNGLDAIIELVTRNA